MEYTTLTCIKAYLQHSDYNVIIVDWGQLSTPRAGQLSSVLYPLVVGNVPRAGEKLADFILYLRSNDFISNLNLVHIIGFSLGAHVSLCYVNVSAIHGNVMYMYSQVSAIAGNSVKRRMGGYRVGRITGRLQKTQLIINVCDSKF